MNVTNKKIININTSLSSVGTNLYEEYGLKYNNELICKYLESNNDQLINHVFTKFIDNVYFNNKYCSISNIFNYKSNVPFYIRYDISKQLKTIDELMFCGCDTLYSVENIGKNFTKIGKYAFNGCINLRYLNLPSTIKKIDSFAFYGTKNLVELNLLNVKKVNNYSFAGCGLREVNIELNNLPHYLFKDCKNLKKIVNKGASEIGDGVFCGCTNLEYVELSNIVGPYTNISDFKEEPQTLPKKFVSQEIKIDVFQLDDEIYINCCTITINTLENLIDDEDSPLYGYIKFEMHEFPNSGEGELMTYYVDPILLDKKNEDLLSYYNENEGIVIEFRIKLAEESEEPEPEIIPISQYKLYDKDYYLIGNLEQSLAERIITYSDSLDDPIVEYTDDGNGNLIIIFTRPLTFVEYYQDGMTPTGRTFENSQFIGDLEPVQYFKLYQAYENIQGGDIIKDNDDLVNHLIFDESFTTVKVRLIGFPVYDPTETYICYYIYNPFLEVRLLYDENLVPLASKNYQAYKDLGLINKDGNKWPVYNSNFCFIGLSTNGQYLTYTNQEELDTYASRIEATVVETNGGPLIQFFALPASYHFSEDFISENQYEYTKEATEKIIRDFLIDTGQLEPDENNEENNSDSNEEEEEIILTYNHFDITDLNYKKTEIIDGEEYTKMMKLPDYTFAGCIKLSNNNIIRKGNVNLSSYSKILFTSNKESYDSKYYIGNWKDYMLFNEYTPESVIYNYEFKWKYVENPNSSYIIEIILNKKIYYIQKIINSNEIIYKFVNSYNNISDDFNVNDFDETNIANQEYQVSLGNYYLSIYDEYPLLDKCEEIGTGAFMNCTSIYSIGKNSFKKINDCAFKDCTKLTSINLLNTEFIGNNAFENCELLGEVNLLKIGSLDSEGVFFNCYNLTKVNNLRITSIPKEMFKNCYSLNINYNDFKNIIEVGKESFLNCYKLSINNFTNIDKFEDYSFCNCKSINIEGETESFKSNVEFGKGVFKGCTNIRNIVFPNTVNKLTYEMFNSCINLESIKFKTKYSDETFELTALDYCNNLKSIHIEDGGRYITPNDNCIFDRSTNTLIYVCKDVKVFNIDSSFGTNEVNISSTAFNNCKVSIIEIDKNISTPNITDETFKDIKNQSYHILLDKTDTKYLQYYEILGKRHLYYK